MKRLPALVLLSCALFSGCDTPSTVDLEVSARIEEPVFTVKPSAFGKPDDPQGDLGGSFTLVLSLGQLASSPTDVEVRSFALVDAATQTALIATLPLPAGAQKIVQVGIAETRRLQFSLSFDKPQPTSKLCAAKQVQYTGTVFDGARGKTTPVTGPAFQPQGCP